MLRLRVSSSDFKLSANQEPLGEKPPMLMSVVSPSAYASESFTKDEREFIKEKAAGEDAVTRTLSPYAPRLLGIFVALLVTGPIEVGAVMGFALRQAISYLVRQFIKNHNRASNEVKFGSFNHEKSDLRLLDVSLTGEDQNTSSETEYHLIDTSFDSELMNSYELMHEVSQIGERVSEPSADSTDAYDAYMGNNPLP